MFGKRIFVLTICCLLCSNVGFFSAAAPTAKVTSPANNSVSLTKAVTVSGTSSGSNASWAKTSMNDFNGETMENLWSSGTDISPLAVYDDFNDSSIDYDKWTVTPYGGMSATESGGQLTTGGTSYDYGVWAASVRVVSSRIVATNISADLTSFSGTGTGWYGGTGLVQDLSNFIFFGVIKDPNLASTPKIYVDVMVHGSPNATTYGYPPSGTLTFAIGLSGGTAYMYLNGNLLTTASAPLSNPRMWFIATPKNGGDSFQANWDNAMLNYYGGSISLAKVYDDFNDNSVSTEKWTATSQNGTRMDIQGN